MLHGLGDELLQVGGPGGLIEDLGDLHLQNRGPHGADEVVELSSGQRHVGADDDQSAGGGALMSPAGRRPAHLLNLLAGQGRVDLLAQSGAHEGRADAVDEGAPLGLGRDERPGQGQQVLLAGDVRGDDLPVARRGEGLDQRLGAGADLGEVRGEHLGGADDPGRLLLDPLGQARGGVAEGRIAGELGLPAGQEVLAHARVVDPAHRDPARLGESRHQDHAVDRLPLLLQQVGDEPGLEREVPPQRGVGAADEGQAPTGLSCGGTGSAHDLTGDALGVLGRERARVGHDVDGLGASAQRPGEVVLGPGGQDRQARDGLGAGGVVIENDEEWGGVRGSGRISDIGRRQIGGGWVGTLLSFTKELRPLRS